MKRKPGSICHEILRETFDQLNALRRKTLTLPDQSQIEPVVIAIKYYLEELPSFDHPLLLAEWCGKALADVGHEIVAAEHGYDSPEADAEFDAGELKLKQMAIQLQKNGINGWHTVWGREAWN